MPLSGELCESRWGWPAVYYLQGTLTLHAFFGFYLFYRDTPRLHKLFFFTLVIKLFGFNLLIIKIFMFIKFETFF